MPPTPVVPQARDRVGVPWARRPWDPQPVSADPADWWAPGALNPHPPRRAVAEASSYAGYPKPYVVGTGAWRVLDLGISATVTARRAWGRNWRGPERVTVDVHGLQIPQPGFAKRERTAIGWAHLTQLMSMHPDGTETWYAERPDGTRVPFVSAPAGDPEQVEELRSIVRGLALFPTRFGLPAVAVDGVVPALVA